MKFFKEYLYKVNKTALAIPLKTLDRMVNELVQLRSRGGRLFFLGVGGSAANCSHAVNDFRKIAGIESYSPCDNISELTARTNDDGWQTTFSSWLKTSKAGSSDAIFVMSVGGGDIKRNISPNLSYALKYAQKHGLKIFGLVGRDGGETAKKGHVVLVIPTVDSKLVTALTESFHAIVWHALVSHPKLRALPNKWEAFTKNK